MLSLHLNIKSKSKWATEFKTKYLENMLKSKVP